MLEELLEAARKQVAKIAKDESKYADLLKKLVLQALFTMMEYEVVVQGRKKDSSAVGKAIESAQSEFKEQTGKEIKITQKDDLSDELAGGVIVTGHSSRLTVDNTLDQRLHIMEECVNGWVELTRAAKSCRSFASKSLARTRCVARGSILTSTEPQTSRLAVYWTTCPLSRIELFDERLCFVDLCLRAPVIPQTQWLARRVFTLTSGIEPSKSSCSNILISALRFRWTTVGGKPIHSTI